MPATRGPPADLPFRDFYEDEAGNRHPFTYVTALEEERIFRVQEADGTPFCVKFCTRYSVEAHRAAHVADLAPALRAVNMVYDWIMVVMDDKTADYSNTVWDLKYAKRSVSANTKPAVSLEEAREKVMTRVSRLHREGFVHGDVRDVHSLVRNETARSPGPDVLLIDWDWAGLQSKTTYPRDVSNRVTRPEVALGGENITVEHDLWMAARLLS